MNSQSESSASARTGTRSPYFLLCLRIIDAFPVSPPSDRMATSACHHGMPSNFLRSLVYRSVTAMAMVIWPYALAAPLTSGHALLILPAVTASTRNLPGSFRETSVVTEQSVFLSPRMSFALGPDDKIWLEARTQHRT